MYTLHGHSKMNTKQDDHGKNEYYQTIVKLNDKNFLNNNAYMGKAQISVPERAKRIFAAAKCVLPMK